MVLREGRSAMSAFRKGRFHEAGTKLVNLVVNVGVDGTGPLKSAQDTAAAALQHADGDVEAAIRHLIASHSRSVGVAGLAAGFGGIASLPISLTADLAVVSTQAARLSAAIAQLRGYDIASEEVRSAVVLSLLGKFGSQALDKLGSDIPGIEGFAALRGLPTTMLLALQRKAATRLMARFTQKGLFKLTKLVPVLAGIVGAVANVAALRKVARNAKHNFPTRQVVLEG